MHVIRNSVFRSLLWAVLMILPWLLLIWQSYIAFEFPVTTDRYQHSFFEHLVDRSVAYVRLLSSPVNIRNATMKSETVAEIVREKSQKYDVDPYLVESIVLYESNFNPNHISTTGAMGLMALMPITTKKYEVRDPFDPSSNIDGGTHLIRDLLDEFDGNIDLVLAAYNAGDLAVKRFRGIPPYTETTDYVKFVSEIYRLLELRSGHLITDQAEAISRIPRCLRPDLSTLTSVPK
jgi:hypothetical protein